MGRRSEGKALVPLLVLLAILAGGGAWNYYQNVKAEEAEPRPFRGLSDRDLTSLIDAYEGEIEAFAAEYERLTGRKVEIVEGRLLKEQVDEFERVQRLSKQTREVARALFEREGSLRGLREEETKREAERDKTRLFLRRLLTIRV